MRWMIEKNPRFNEAARGLGGTVEKSGVAGDRLKGRDKRKTTKGKEEKELYDSTTWQWQNSTATSEMVVRNYCARAVKSREITSNYKVKVRSRDLKVESRESSRKSGVEGRGLEGRDPGSRESKVKSRRSKGKSQRSRVQGRSSDPCACRSTTLVRPDSNF